MKHITATITAIFLMTASSFYYVEIIWLSQESKQRTDIELELAWLVSGLFIYDESPFEPERSDRRKPPETKSPCLPKFTEADLRRLIWLLVYQQIIIEAAAH